jgi:hypothetical protein
MNELSKLNFTPGETPGEAHPDDQRAANLTLGALLRDMHLRYPEQTQRESSPKPVLFSTFDSLTQTYADFETPDGTDVQYYSNAPEEGPTTIIFGAEDSQGDFVGRSYQWAPGEDAQRLSFEGDAPALPEDTVATYRFLLGE